VRDWVELEEVGIPIPQPAVFPGRTQRLVQSSSGPTQKTSAKNLGVLSLCK